MMWSKRSMPKIFPASLILVVTLISSLEGVQSKEG